MLRSTACRYEHLTTAWFLRGCHLLGLDPVVRPEVPASRRKQWEWCAILQALEERDMLHPGRRGMGFAVGTEKLTAIFAGLGVDILASDAPSEQHWGTTGEHAASREVLFHSDCITRDDFDERVRFEPVDMTSFDHLPDGEFDFLWSSCAMEHLGSLDAGTDFVKKAMRLLKPGGVAVHTTEFNCSSNEETLDSGWNVVYRRRDIESLADELRLLRCGMEPLDFDIGTHSFDLDFDEEPYFTRPNAHIKLMLGDFVATSFLMIIRKGNG